MPRKALRAAARMALLSKFQDDQAIVLSEWNCTEPKTRVVANVLASLGVAGESVLLATDGLDGNVRRSARNIENVQVLPASDLNAWVLLRNRRLVVTVAALDCLLSRSAAAVV